jgi:AcrR family transcriptional regulator
VYDVKAEEKKEQILAAAKDVFARYGFKKTTVSDIGDAVGMTKSNLYFYFTNKKDLYDQVIRYSMLEWYRRMEQASTVGHSSQQRLINASRMAFEYLSEDTRLCSIIANDRTILPFSNKENRFIDVSNQTMELYISIIKDGQRDGIFRMVDPFQTAQLLYSVLTVLIIQSYVKHDGVNGEQFDHTLDIIIKGLLA